MKPPFESQVDTLSLPTPVKMRRQVKARRLPNLAGGAAVLDPLHTRKLPNLQEFPSPCYVLDLAQLRKNMRLLNHIQSEANCSILLALKSFATWSAFDQMSPFLSGCCASGVWEARLGREKFGGEVHTYAPAFTDEDVSELLQITDHLTFNSLSQWFHFRTQVLTHKRSRHMKFGLRINPEASTSSYALYDPCAPMSRLGIRSSQLKGADMAGITGFHSHTLCQQGVDALETTLHAIEEKFSFWLPQLQWINLGGGHHITREDYDVNRLIKVLKRFSGKWNLKVYLEPGEAHVYKAGYLVASVLDIVENEMDIALVDVSATAHMPDVLEMPYRPPLAGSGEAGEKTHTYRIGSTTCLSGDIIGDYSFDQPLKAGDRILFEDQAQYTLVKTTMFNGIKHPAIALWDPDLGELRVVREFGYEDFRSRLS